MKRFSTSPLLSFDRPARWFLLALVVDGMATSGWSLFYNLYYLAQGYDRQFLGLLNAMPSAAALVVGVPMGLLSDRIGRKRAMLFGLILGILAMIVQTIASQPALILLGAFLGGTFGMLFYLSQAPFMLSTSNNKNRDLLFSLSFAMYPFAAALGSLLAGQLPARLGSFFDASEGSAQVYQVTLLVCTLVRFVTIIPLVLIREPRASASQDKVAKPEETKSSLREVILRPVTLKISLPNLVTGLGAAMLIPYLNVFFAERHHASNAALGILFSLSSLVTGAACVVSPRLSHHLGSKIRAMVITQAASLIFLVMLGFSPFLWLAALSFLMRGALMNMSTPLYSAFAMEQVSASEQGTLNSVKEMAWQVGWVIGPYLSGLVQESYGFTPLFIGTSMLYIVAIGLTWIFFGLNEKGVGTPGLQVERT